MVSLPQRGDLIAGKYQVEEMLGQGGMGAVVAARHLVLRQRVALKFLLPAGLRLPGACERFLREAQAAAALQSEHVARVHDVGALETGAPYLVMEYLYGSNLSRLLKSRGPLPIALAVDLVLQACEAIGEAHALGIVHRDLKPQNLFIVTRSGAPFVKVLDFGLSRVPLQAGEAPDVSITATDLVIGSPQYMSPEQFRSFKHVDARTDLWALGVILYQLLTGRRPFVGSSVIAICASIAADVPPPLKTYRPEVPAPLDALVRRCLEKDLARRVQSVAELVQELAPFASTRTGLAERRDPSFASAPVLPSRALLPALAAPVPEAATAPDRTTVRLGTSAQAQRRPRPQTLALFAMAGAVVAIGALAIAGVLWWRSLQGEATLEPAAAANALPAVTAPAATSVNKKEAAPSNEGSSTAAPPAPAYAPTAPPRPLPGGRTG
jgi:eukaryotic-like serine/threonine-protein kinase